VAVPDLVTLLGVIAPHVRPEGTMSVNVTVPENPFSGLTVIVAVVGVPTLAEVGGDAVMVKSWNENIAVALWTSRELVPLRISV
jgi:hypothetical protein